MRTRGWAAALCTAVMLAGAAWAQATYLEEAASNPETTRGEARLLHYLPDDLPIEVHIAAPDRPDADAVREQVMRAFEAWEDAAPELVSFRFVDEPTEESLRVRWQEFEDDRVGSYVYRFSTQESGAYRFWTTEVLLDPRYEREALFRYALLQAGHAIGLLGRSPFEGDAMSTIPSGQISERDIATLEALYATPSGTVVDP